ncbi:MAG: hypothetical protein GC168_13045 [Candidatus Hydrogenedens sp.]|nr:hypothetical protein [Candidatus Hydrogenedens sp.]
MTPARTMEHMLRKLLSEMDYVQSQGAGYYTCAPFARRFNKLLEQAMQLIGAANPLIATFDALDETDPKDPGDKSKRLLQIRIEITQLISFLETVDEGETA